jgi:hypothetical protein
MNVLRWVPAVVAFSSSAFAGESAISTPIKNERGGFVFGLTGGLAMGTAAGYPNDLQKIDMLAYFGAGGVMVGESSGFMLMGAFARELSFGVWLNQSHVQSTSGNWRSNGYGGGFRVEVFPVGWLVPALRDLGFIGMFGIGAADLAGNVGNYPGAEGVQSYLGTGAFYEWMFLHPGKTRWVVGPSVEYQLVTSRSLERNVGMFGVRFAFYSGR